MLLTSTLRAALAGSTLAVAALALPSPQEKKAPPAPQAQQLQALGGSAPRMAATRLFFAPQFELKGMVCVQYGQPAWKAEYDAMIDKLKGKQLRLGKDFWTTFNTSVALDVGGTQVPAGAYYLGLKCGADGAFSLALLKAEAADKAGFAPFAADAWKIDFTAPMKHATGDKQVDAMTMDLNVDEKDPTLLTFVVSWGKHTLSVPMKAKVG
jgi:hypothetical protein